MKTINISPFLGTPLILALFVIALAYAVARLFRATNRASRQSLNWGMGFYVALWTTLVGCASVIWIATVLHQNGGVWRAFGFGIAAVVLLTATFILEGLEAAVSELRDKDEHQLSAPVGNLFQRLSKEEDAFFETREWLAVALVVIATLMMESDHYFIPVVGLVNGSPIQAIDIDGEKPLGHFIRIALSLILSTFPFVWLAEGPGKHVARRNSVQFLRYSVIQFSVQIVESAWRIMRILGLQYPAAIANHTALLLLKESRKSRYLPPSEFSFFSDSLKRYGYGSPITDLKIIIHKDGSAEVDSKFLAYLITPRSAVSRIFSFENGYIAETKQRLILRNSQDTRWWAFEVPLIGERITQSLLKAWEELFYSDDPSKWNFVGAKELDSKFFTAAVTITDPDSSTPPTAGTRPVSTLTVKLNFRGDLPQKDAAEKAVLILWSVRLRTNPGTFVLPENWEEHAEYPYDIKFTHPCLRATTTFTFSEGNRNKEGDYIFVEPRSDEHFQVIYGNIIHEGESQRFKCQSRGDLFSAPPRVAPPGQSFTFVLDSALPSALYKTRLWIERSYPPRQLEQSTGTSGVERT